MITSGPDSCNMLGFLQITSSSYYILPRLIANHGKIYFILPQLNCFIVNYAPFEVITNYSSYYKLRGCYKLYPNNVVNVSFLKWYLKLETIDVSKIIIKKSKYQIYRWLHSYSICCLVNNIVVSEDGVCCAERNWIFILHFVV